jgi:hypothetical protein
MKKLVFAVLVVVASSCGRDNKTTPDTSTTPPPDTAGPDCFMGTATAHDQLINACVDQSVTRIVKYPTLAAEIAALPKLNPDGSLPPPP